MNTQPDNYVLSIDVGIKNFAYCLFLLEDINKLHIKDWNVISICPVVYDKCKDVSCSNYANFQNASTYVCASHLPENCICIDNKTTIPNKKTEILNWCVLHKIDYPNERTVKLVKKNLSNRLFYPCLPKDSKTTKHTLIEIGKTMTKVFDTTFSSYFSVIRTVIIENQISPIANRMKTIQGMITQYFIMRLNTNPSIHFICSKNKLKGVVGKKKTYKERKQLGIRETHLHLKNHYESDNKTYWMNFYNSHKKKDDLADAFLQGKWWIQKS